MNAATTSSDHSLMPAASRQRSTRRMSMSSSSRSMREGFSGMSSRVENRSDGQRRLPNMTNSLHYGPARVPSRESPEAAVELLLERGYSACEIDFEGKFWMDYPWAERFGELAREAGIVLSVHAPIAGFMGHLDRDKKFRMAVGMLDHSAGIAVAAGAEIVVFHPGFLLGRTRRVTITAVCKQLAE